MATFVNPSRWQDELSEQELRDCLSIPSCEFVDEKPWWAVLRVRGHTKAFLVHAITDEDMTLEHLLLHHIELPRDIFERLMYFGAVHWSRIPPEAPSYLAHADVACDIRHRAMESLVSSGYLETIPQKQRARLSKTERVLNASVMIPAYSYVRIHMVPKRFPVFYRVDWSKQVIAHAEEYIVMNKPSGLPVPPTVDNMRENILMGASKALEARAEDTFLITSRIDQATEGIVVLGKTPDFVRQFNGLIVNRSVRKKYKAAVVVPSDPTMQNLSSLGGDLDHLLGDVKHNVRVKYRTPGLPFLTLVTDVEDSNSVECHMIIESARELHDEVSQTIKQTFGIYKDDRVYELQIDLITGRTHQIRCQLSALGYPIIGDTLYGPLADEGLRQALLENPHLVVPHVDGKERLLQEPPGPIALQAFCLQFGPDHNVFQDRIGDPVTFEIETAWWHHNHPS